MGKSFIMIKESRANANGTNWEKQYIHEWNSFFVVLLQRIIIHYYMGTKKSSGV